MAGKRGRFTVNTGRIDPYRNFKFRVAIGAVLSAIAGIFMLKKFLPPASEGEAKDYLTPKPSHEPPRPINSVGTSTARRAGGTPKAGAPGKARSPRGGKGAGAKRASRRKPR